MKNKTQLEKYDSFVEGLIFKYEDEWTEPFQKTLPNGIVLAGSPENVELLEEMLADFEHSCEMDINPDAVKIIAMGEMPYNAPGGFCIETKTIKLHPVSSRQDRQYGWELIFLHEYTHALDCHLDLYKKFEDEYREMIEAVGYKYHESEDSSWKIGVDPGFNGDIVSAMGLFASNRTNDSKIKEMGYCGLRCALNIREFVAMAFMHWFSFHDYEEDFNSKVGDLLEKHFNRNIVEA